MAYGGGEGNRRGRDSNNLFLLNALVLFFLLSGCSVPQKPPAHIYPGTPASSLRAAASIESEDTGTKSRATVILKHPDLLRLEVYGPADRLITVIAARGGNCLIYSMGEVRPCGKDLIYLEDPGELVTVLLGKTLKAGERKDREIVTDRLGRLRKFSRLKDGVAVVTVEVKEYKDLGGVEIPYRVTVESGGAKILIEYHSVELNPEIDDRLFTLPAPPEN